MEKTVKNILLRTVHDTDAAIAKATTEITQEMCNQAANILLKCFHGIGMKEGMANALQIELKEMGYADYYIDHAVKIMEGKLRSFKKQQNGAI